MKRVRVQQWLLMGLVGLLGLVDFTAITAQDNQPKGAYVLVNVGRDVGDFEKGGSAKLLSFSDNHAVLTAGSNFQGNPNKPCFRTTLHRWNTPPTVLRPGEVFNFELYIQNQLLSNKWDAHIGDVTSARVDTDIGGPLWTNDRVDKPVVISGQVNYTYPASKIVKETIEWKIPAVRQFKTLRITYVFAANTGGKVWYDYEWQDNPQPKNIEIRKPKPGEDSLETYVKPTDIAVDSPTPTDPGTKPTPVPPGNPTTPTPPTTPGNTGKPDSTNAPVPTGFTVKIGKVKVKAGENVTLPVEVFKPTDVSSLNVEIGYSATVANVKEKPVAGELKGNRLFEANHGESGVVLVGLAGSAPLNSDGQLAVISFTAVGKPGEKTPLTVKVTSANLSSGGPVTAATIDGELEIVSQSPGDINSDGVVDPRDALDALKMSVRLLPINLAADMDGNGAITANDARMILLKAVGK